MKSVKLYFNDVCPFAYRVRLMLAEKRIEYEPIEVDLNQTPDWFYEISADGKVPLLTCNKDKITESNVINEYLDETFTDTRLLGLTPVQRAQARIWIEFCNTAFQPNCCGLVFELDEKKHPAIRQALDDSLETIEQHLASHQAGPYWMGDTLSLVDLTFYPFFEHACVLSHYRDYKISTSHTHLLQWIKKMSERPSVIRNCRDNDFYIDAYKPYVEGDINH